MKTTGRTGALGAEIEGSLLAPGDARYDDACSVWNTRFESRPALIVRAESAVDVAAAVRFARDEGLAIAVKGGGHDYAGNSASRGGLLIDLSPMKSITIHPDARRASVEGGVTWGEFDVAAQAHGLAATGGSVSSVGVAGFMLGGGEGWLSRACGHGVDNLMGAEVVTATGEVVRASLDENPDLFWGLRGGGGNFGVVTTFDIRLHPVGPELMVGQVFYPYDEAGGMLRFYRDYFADAPDEISCYAFTFRVPPVDPFPSDHHGRLTLDFVLAYTGPVEDGEAAFEPFRALGAPILELVGAQPYVTLQRSFDEALPGGARWYSRASFLPSLTDQAIDVLVAGLQDMPGPLTSSYLGAAGGVAGRVDPTDTAYPHRGDGFGLHVFPGWMDPAQDEEIKAWTREVHAAVAPHASPGVYVNMLGEDERARIPSCYGANYRRLVALKRDWDPDNVFSGNHNVGPGE